MEYTKAVPAAFSFVMNPSGHGNVSGGVPQMLLVSVRWKARGVTGKSVEWVKPFTYTLPPKSTAICAPHTSKSLPPK
jgi:hypothetical protein